MCGHQFRENTLKPASTVGICSYRLEMLKYRMDDKEKNGRIICGHQNEFIIYFFKLMHFEKVSTLWPSFKKSNLNMLHIISKIVRKVISSFSRKSKKLLRLFLWCCNGKTHIYDQVNLGTYTSQFIWNLLFKKLYVYL